MSRKKKFLVNFKNREKNKLIKNNPQYFIFYDTETNQRLENKRIGKKDYDTIINSLYMGWACFYDRETGEERWFYFEKIKEFHRWVSKIITETGDKQLWIIAHNIVFDNIITDIWSIFDKRNFETDFIHSKGMSFIHKLKSKKNKNVVLLNNGNIFPARLEVIGQTVGLPKLDVDFDESSKEYMKIYCKRDVEILLEFWKQWIEFIETNGLGKIKYTISSQSMETFKYKFCDKYVLLGDELDVLDFERKAYYGGRTEIFYKGIVKKKINYYDVNSMYPHVMKDYRYPTEYKFSKDKPKLDYVKYLIDKGWLVVAECNIETEKRLYPLKAESLLFPVGKFTTYLCTPEVIEGLKNGDIKSFGKVQFYHGEYLFSDYVDYFYENRQRLKNECQISHEECKKCRSKCEHKGNKKEMMFKLFLNSLYGKFGQKTDKWEETTEEEIRNIINNFDLDNWIMDIYKIPKIILGGMNITPKLRYIANQLQVSTEEEESDISFPAIAGHVTSYARLIIWKALNYCWEHNTEVYYCDTDSLFISGDLPEEMVSQKELGKLKIEKVFEHGVEFINLKNYCELNETGNKVVESEEGEIIVLDDTTFLNDTKVIKGGRWVMKGVSNNAEMLNKNTFIQQEWGGLPKQEYYKKFGRKAGEFWVTYKTKVNHDKINKGIVELDGHISPIKY